MIAPIMKQHIDQPALFIRLRGDETELSAVKTRYAKARSKRCAWLGRPSDQAPPINDRACAGPTTRP